ncbi:MAG: hypothetical protein VX906_00530 [Candidatus Thermoplasmatota archaeon]|nr:hypothetical protein [Candidatus Thermoplasmatota archaeon]
MWGWVVFLGGTSVILLWMSRAQPFPEISGRWALMMMGIAGLLAISMSSPRATEPYLPALLSGLFGGSGIIIGSVHDRRNRDVILSPFAGMWFVASCVYVLTEDWAEYNNVEQIVGFVLATVVVMLEIFLFWKGLIIGVQGRSWSQAALRQLDRGLIDGERGAVSMFEKSWSVDESWLDAMSHAALAKIHAFKGDLVSAKKHTELLERLGGEDSVEQAWLDQIDSCLNRLKSSNDECE